jgi:hypothetical protein
MLIFIYNSPPYPWEIDSRDTPPPQWIPVTTDSTEPCTYIEEGISMRYRKRVTRIIE